MFPVICFSDSRVFEIEAENVPCGETGVTCTKSLTIKVGQNIVHFIDGDKVMLNGEALTLRAGQQLLAEHIYFFNQNLINILYFSDIDVLIKADAGKDIMLLV